MTTEPRPQMLHNSRGDNKSNQPRTLQFLQHVKVRMLICFSGQVQHFCVIHCDRAAKHVPSAAQEGGSLCRLASGAVL